MHRRLYKCCVLVMLIGLYMNTGILYADDEPEFEAEFRDWKLAGMFSGSLNLTQFSDWQAGGNDTLTITGRSDFWAVRSNDRHDWKNRLRAVYGISKNNGEDRRTSADSLKLDSRYEYKMNTRAFAYFRGYAETSLAPKHVHFDTAKDVILDGDIVYRDVDKFRIASGFDPINLEQGIGVGYTLYENPDETSEAILMAGIGSRQVVSRSYYVEKDDSATPEIEYETVGDDFEMGFEMVLDATITINSHVKFTSFAALFLGLHDNLWRSRWDNSLDVSLGQYVGISFTADIVYDESVFDSVQYKTGTLITLSYRIF
jgi:hypothetical protein